MQSAFKGRVRGLSLPLPLEYLLFWSQPDWPFLDIFGWPLFFSEIDLTIIFFPSLHCIPIEEIVKRTRNRATSLWSEWVPLPLSNSIAKETLHGSFPALAVGAIRYFWLSPTCISIATMPTAFSCTMNAGGFLFFKYSHKCALQDSWPLLPLSTNSGVFPET